MNFAHLGAELRMRTKPLRSRVDGSLVPRGTAVSIQSAISADVVGTVTKGTGLSRLQRALQHLPFVGRLIEHGTGA
jgi:hypothetical protein